jgi:hypothetical protein
MSEVCKAEEKKNVLAARFARPTQTIKTDNNHFSPADFGRRKGCHGLRPGRVSSKSKGSGVKREGSGFGSRVSERQKKKKIFRQDLQDFTGLILPCPDGRTKSNQLLRKKNNN